MVDIRQEGCLLARMDAAIVPALGRLALPALETISDPAAADVVFSGCLEDWHAAGDVAEHGLDFGLGGEGFFAGRHGCGGAGRQVGR